MTSIVAWRKSYHIYLRTLILIGKFIAMAPLQTITETLITEVEGNFVFVLPVLLARIKTKHLNNYLVSI